MAAKDFMPWDAQNMDKELVESDGYWDLINRAREQQQRQLERTRNSVEAMVADFLSDRSDRQKNTESAENICVGVHKMLQDLRDSGMLPKGRYHVECHDLEPGRLNVKVVLSPPMDAINLDVIIDEARGKSKSRDIILCSTPVEPEAKPKNRFKELLF